jgi:GH25 family lysozyme M1 (1,4-beta-N-acetylmuramidase)
MARRTSSDALTIPNQAEAIMAGDPDRQGTFLITDIYPRDLGPNPPFHVLPGMTVNGKEVVGCVVKASQSTGWGKTNEAWFARSWKKIRDVAGDRYGVDFFRGCYHFLVFSVDGAKQADYFCDRVEAAGGFDSGDLMPWVDAEEGGQGKWAPQKLETITDSKLRARLADNVTSCTTAFVDRFRKRTGLRIAVYGRGIFRDLHMTHCTFGADSAVNPAYTATMPKMDKYGVPLDHITFWQCCGDGTVVLPGFPSKLPGWGSEDYSVYIDGSRKTTLKSLRKRSLARAT